MRNTQQDYPKNKFVVDHSEDNEDGKTLIMKIGPSKHEKRDIDVIAYEVQNTNLNGFEILQSKEGRLPVFSG